MKQNLYLMSPKLGMITTPYEAMLNCVVQDVSLGFDHYVLELKDGKITEKLGNRMPKDIDFFIYSN